MASATTLPPPIVTGEATEEGHVIQWELPPGVEADAVFVEIYRNETLDDVVSLAGDVGRYVHPDPGLGTYKYLVSYEDDGDESAPGVTVLPGWPYCTDWVVIKTAPPFVFVNDDCIFPLPFP